MTWDNVEIKTQFRSVTQSCLSLCDPMDWSTFGFPALCHPLELAQTHVHWVSDAIQPLHLSSPSPTSVFPSIRVFSNELVLHIRWPKYWSFSVGISPSNEYSRLISFRTDFPWSPCSLKDSQESSPTSQFKSISSLVLSFLYGPTLTTIHDYGKKP